MNNNYPNFKSSGYRTDLIFNHYDGKVIDRGEYVVATSENNPHYFWGNLLIYKRPPAERDLERWKEAFHKEITHPEIHHLTFGWDSPTGELGAIGQFLEDGFSLAQSVVLSTTHVAPPPKYNSEIEVRLVESHQDFESVIQIQLASAEDYLSKDSWEQFYRKQMTLYRRIIDLGRGAWFGAYLNNQIVGSLGIFSEGELGRYQIVSTHPLHQRKGICGTLVYQSALYAFQKMNLKKLIMIADENYHAAKIYESVGFLPTEKMVGVNWFDKTKV